MSKKVFTNHLSEPLNGATTARIEINAGTGNLMVGGLADGEPVLAKGELEYLEKQNPPIWSVETINGQASLTLKADGARQSGLRLPWQACNGETNWRIELNPAVASDLTAHSGGGNVKLDLSGMAVTRVVADTGGGNLEVILPDRMTNLNLTAQTGAGNVTIRVPDGVAARIHARTGWGKVITDPRFIKLDDNTFQSAEFDGAADKVEIAAHSGAGNVSVIAR